MWLVPESSSNAPRYSDKEDFLFFAPIVVQWIKGNSMTDTELKNLKDNLWHSADMLRAGAHLAANKYGQPILGLIFLRYADVLFKQHKAEIDAEYNKYKGSRMEREYKNVAVEKCGFFLPECAYFDYINDAPDDANKALLVKRCLLYTSPSPRD